MNHFYGVGYKESYLGFLQTSWMDFFLFIFIYLFLAHTFLFKLAKRVKIQKAGSGKELLLFSHV